MHYFFKFVFLMLIPTNPTVAQTLPSVRILESVTVPVDTVVYFKDVAVLESIAPEYKTDLENVRIADNSQEYLKMTNQDLLGQIRPALKKIEQDCDCKISLHLPRSLQNHSMQGDFSIEKVSVRVMDALKSQCEDCEFIMEPLRISQGTAPEKYSSWELDGSIKNLRGPATVSVYFDQKTLEPLLLSTKVFIKKPALRFLKTQSAGAALEAAQFENVMTDVTYEPRKTAQLSDLETSELKRSLGAGQILFAEDLVEQHLVRVGQPLSIEVSHGSFHIKLAGVAQRSGRKGEQIPVRVNRTKKDMFAEVVGEGRVRMQR